MSNVIPSVDTVNMRELCRNKQYSLTYILIVVLCNSPSGAPMGCLDMMRKEVLHKAMLLT